MPKKKKGGTKLGRNARSGSQKNSRTGHLHGTSAQSIAARAAADERAPPPNNNPAEELSGESAEDPRVYDLKKEIQRRNAKIEKLKSDVATAWEEKKKAEATGKKVTEEFTRKVQQSEKEAEESKKRADAAEAKLAATEQQCKDAVNQP